MHKVFFLTFFIAASTAVLFIGCSQNNTESMPVGKAVKSVETKPEKNKTPQPVTADKDTFTSHVLPYIEEHCFSCHNENKKKGKFRLDNLGIDFSKQNVLNAWTEVYDILNLGEMPPEDEPQPKAEQTLAVTDWIAGELRNSQMQQNSSHGRVVMRRLTRQEYANSIQDLFKLQYERQESPAETLAPDGNVRGFSKHSKALILDPSLLEAYYKTAQKMVNKAFDTTPPEVPQYKSRLYFRDAQYKRSIAFSELTSVTENGVMGLFNRGIAIRGVTHPYNDKIFPVEGTYTIRVKMGADLRESKKPVVMNMSIKDKGIFFNKSFFESTPLKIYEYTGQYGPTSGREIIIAHANGKGFYTHNYYGFELGDIIKKNSHDGEFVSQTLGRLSAEGSAHGTRKYLPHAIQKEKLPRLLLDYIEVEGPIQESWPPARLKKIFYAGLDEGQFNDQYARGIIRNISNEAWRRPVADEEINSLFSLYSADRHNGAEFIEALKTAAIAILCSPEFIYLNKYSSEQKRTISEHELATRLSYFLWSSLPDAALTDLANAGTLRSNLDQQIDRMLKDKRVQSFVDGFAGEWLKAADFNRFAPDRHIYKDIYSAENAGLIEDMNREPIEFFNEILLQNRPLSSFLKSDWTMLNEKLARHYGIANVHGKHFRPVSLAADSHRGGLITMAAFHKWGSDGLRTKPVDRGKYILDVLFNDPAPPPPPNAGEVEPNIGNQRLTVRQRLEKHQEIESCAACHRRIDPYGFGVENFNVAGKWRLKFAGERGRWRDKQPAIDASGKLPNGRIFADSDEFRQALYEQKERFFKGFTEKLVSYALGRSVEGNEQATIQGFVEELNKTDNLKVLIKAIIKNQVFQTK